jgi:hypothetical protein
VTSIEQLAYELSASALGEQERAVDSLRARAGTVLAAAAIAASFLATKTTHHGAVHDLGSVLTGSFRHGHLSWALTFVAFAGAFVAFVGACVAAIWVLFPRELTFAFDGTTLLGESDARGGVLATEGHRALVLWMDPLIELNRDRIQHLTSVFAFSCGCLGVEIVLWTVSLA